jgi:protein phosphatase
MTTKISVPELSLVLLVGTSGAGKSTFARKHFKSTEVLSSDVCRGLVCDDETDQSATKDAFEVLRFVASKRLAAGRLTVVDATNLRSEDRKPLLELCREHDVLPVAIVFQLPERLCHERNRGRPDRDFGPHVLRQQSQLLRRSLNSLKREGFRHVFVLTSPEEADAAAVERQPLWTNRKQDRGPFDIIGDVHGCRDELALLLDKLGYLALASTEGGSAGPGLVHPQGRKAVFLGDLVDRGPDTPGVLRLVLTMVRAGSALCVPGNHDMKLLRKLRGRDVRITHGLAESLEQLGREPPEFVQEAAAFLDGLVSHYVLDEGRLVVAHAGLKASLQGRASGRVRDFALFGETTGETDEYGLPVRYNWASEYRGPAYVVYGHTPTPEPEWLNRTINIDTGCVFGGRLTALRYPERELVSVPAARMYYAPAKPFLPEATQAPPAPQPRQDDLLDIEDVLGKRIISTRLQRSVTIREENAAAALEVMSRFAIDPRLLIYLPPTMSPSETSRQPGLLEHPLEAFAYYQREGIPRVIVQEKHMGSRCVLVVCRDQAAALRRFRVPGGRLGTCYTRTGRPFFHETQLEEQLLGRVRAAAEAAGLWDELGTDWICLDCELMPWSAKAQELLRQQYAAVGAAARAATSAAVTALEQAFASGLAEVGPQLERQRQRAQSSMAFTEAYRRYCWPVASLADLKLAPFHLLASEGAVHVHRDHLWHMQTLARLCRADAEAQASAPVLLETRSRIVDVTDPASQQQAVDWWQELTGRGGEGVVVKPLDFIARGRRGLVQPAVKCRGREYLRIIYGPEYTAPENLERLRKRGLSAKRSLALREFALGVEALERFVAGEPLYRVHECGFGVLALESEPVDPRL